MLLALTWTSGRKGAEREGKGGGRGEGAERECREKIGTDADADAECLRFKKKYVPRGTTMGSNGEWESKGLFRQSVRASIIAQGGGITHLDVLAEVAVLVVVCIRAGCRRVTASEGAMCQPKLGGIMHKRRALTRQSEGSITVGDARGI